MIQWPVPQPTSPPNGPRKDRDRYRCVLNGQFASLCPLSRPTRPRLPSQSRISAHKRCSSRALNPSLNHPARQIESP